MCSSPQKLLKQLLTPQPLVFRNNWKSWTTHWLYRLFSQFSKSFIKEIAKDNQLGLILFQEMTGFGKIFQNVIPLVQNVLKWVQYVIDIVGRPNLILQFVKKYFFQFLETQLAGFWFAAAQLLVLPWHRLQHLLPNIRPIDYFRFEVVTVDATKAPAKDEVSRFAF